MPHYTSPALTVEDTLHDADVSYQKKRQAMLIPSKLNLAAHFQKQAEEEEEECYSTWEFNAPAEPSTQRRPKMTADAILSAAQKIDGNFRITAPTMTAAQQIAYQYRAGLKIDFDFIDSTASSSRSSSTEPSILAGSESNSWVESSEDSESDSEVQCSLMSPVIEEPKLRHSESRSGAIAEAAIEVLDEIRSLGLSPAGRIVCPRDECRAMLPNIRALTYHIAIHDIDKPKRTFALPPIDTSRMGPFFCLDCDHPFTSRSDLNAHACPSRSRSAPSSPIFATFHHVLTRITSLN